MCNSGALIKGRGRHLLFYIHKEITTPKTISHCCFFYHPSHRNLFERIIPPQTRTTSTPRLSDKRRCPECLLIRLSREPRLSQKPRLLYTALSQNTSHGTSWLLTTSLTAQQWPMHTEAPLQKPREPLTKHWVVLAEFGVVRSHWNL